MHSTRFFQAVASLLQCYVNSAGCTHTRVTDMNRNVLWCAHVLRHLAELGHGTTTAFRSSTESDRTVEWESLPSAVSVQSDFSGEQSRGSPPGLFSAAPHRYAKNYCMTHFRIHLQAVSVFCSFRKIVPEPSELRLI